MASPDLSYLDIRQGPKDAPHKPVLLLALMRAMEVGLVSENKFVVTDELIRLFYSYWKELVRSDHSAKFHLPFYHLSNDGSGIWQIQKLPGFEANALTSSRSIKSLGALRTYVAYGKLRDDVFLKWMDPVHRELARQYLLGRYFPVPDEEAFEEGSAWSAEEVQPTIEAYFDMVSKSLAEEKVVKAHVYRSLEVDGLRTAKSYEFKMQNISAVLALNDLPFMRGLVPAKNFQRSLEPQVLAYLDQHPAMRSRLLEYGKMRSKQLRLIVDPAETPTIVQEPAPTYGSSTEGKRSFKASKVDFAAREHACRRLGTEGEQAVVAYEKEQLTHAGRPDLAAEVEWVAQTQGDGLGYDIRSFTADYEERFIEVKTSNFDRDTPFLITDNEVAFSKENPDQYLLYRLFDFARSPKFYTLNGSVEEACVLAPVRYRAWAR